MALPNPEEENNEKDGTEQQDQSSSQINSEAKPEIESLVFALPTVPDPHNKSNS